ncbi:Bifunctional NAD(P)H-hydrate repair enzyme Nnr [Sulfitobacter sp. THAF37]|uniref:NAD(P)H-hydrate dehydratase n=1 Tax=Sulfitobacter sp. THAF37 TaxID=2587855 RepID=UPI0012682516|nr:Bifunctional NAD(P)H-hydrate repair enzyme Nnr [Sulfitobacter sp. THAF37]
MVHPITRDTLDLALLRKGQGHKYDHGHVLVLSGGPGRTGAARLAARAALRIGAGAVTLGVPPAAQLEVAVQVTAVMLARVGDAAALHDLLAEGRFAALCLGPGFGMDANQQALVEGALDSGLPCVLDADALTIIGKSPTLIAGLHDACVLTPHLGEFRRVFGDIAASFEAKTMTKAQATAQAAQKAGCTVLLKGAETTIAAPDGSVTCHAATGARAVPWLATAGAGDTLAGMITGLLARGVDPASAAETATWLHAECARSFGPGLIAEDLAEELPKVLRGLGL